MRSPVIPASINSDKNSHRHSRVSTADSVELEIRSKPRSSQDDDPPSQESQQGLTSQQARPIPSREGLLPASSDGPSQSARKRTSYAESSCTNTTRPTSPLSPSSHHVHPNHSIRRKMRESFRSSRDGRARSEFLDLGQTPEQEREDYEWAAQAKAHSLLPPAADDEEIVDEAAHRASATHHVVGVEGSGWDGKGSLVMNDKGKPTRRYKLHPGSNRFFLRGRILTSRDSIWTFAGSVAVAVSLPVLFLVFNAAWLWHDYAAGGGKAVVILFSYFTVMMWINMLRTAWSDPGICAQLSFPPSWPRWHRIERSCSRLLTVPRGLHEPDTELIACAPGSPEDIGSGMAERAKARYIRVRDEIVTSKCACASYLSFFFSIPFFSVRASG